MDSLQDIIDNRSDEDGYEIVPGSEMVVTRIAYQNNQSKYQIDGCNSNFTEVTDLLRTKGIDLDNNRFLILQGEVSAVVIRVWSDVDGRRT